MSLKLKLSIQQYTIVCVMFRFLYVIFFFVNLFDDGIESFKQVECDRKNFFIKRVWDDEEIGILLPF